jgi:hypothetical protein
MNSNNLLYLVLYETFEKFIGVFFFDIECLANMPSE